MRDLFGNPEDGTFLAWLADDGVWAGLITLGAIVLWVVLRYYLHRLLATSAEALERAELDLVSGRGRALIGFFAEGPILLAAVGLPATVWVLAVLDRDVGPATDALGVVGSRFGNSVAGHAIPIIVIGLLAYAGMRALKRFVPPLVRQFVKTDGEVVAGLDEAEARASTLAAVLTGTAVVLVWTVALFSVLAEIGVPVGPLLAGFGIAGIAVGFGAQSLVKDMIAGFFIVGENQYRRGDVVQIAGIAGLVEQLNLRRTQLRDLEGRVHIVPNGEISVSTNFTKNWSRVLLDIGVAYKEDLDHVIRVLNEVGEQIASEDEWKDQIIETPQVLRVNSFDDSSITIRVLGVCRPLTQWGIMGEMRRRIKRRFDEENIEIPFPHRTVYWGEAPGNRANVNVTSQAESIAAEAATPEEREAQMAEMAIAAQAMRSAAETGQAEEDEKPIAPEPSQPAGRPSEFVISDSETGAPLDLEEARAEDERRALAEAAARAAESEDTDDEDGATRASEEEDERNRDSARETLKIDDD